jgi:TolB-like protein/tetratricopeptide (TPR) repeat protein
VKIDNFFAELKRRNVYKVAVAYAVVGWLVVQISSTVLPTFHAPEWVVQMLVVLVALGFPIALVIAWAFELTPEGIKRTEDVAPTESITRRTGRKLVSIIAILGVVALGLFLFQVVRTERRDKSNAPSPPASEKSVAVLPFTDLSAAHDQEYFGDGLAEELLNVLVQVDGLSVASRTSSFAFKGKNLSVPAIAQALGVAHIVEGSVRRVDNRVRVTAQLIDVATDRHLWSQSFDREATDIFVIQEDIARSIAESLKVRLGKASGSNPGTGNVAAYDQYLLGLYHLNQRTEDGLRKALEIFREATERDPTFARAFAGLSMTYTLLPGYASFDPDLADREALAAARKAVALDPKSAEALTALAQAYANEGKYGGALEKFDRALALNPRFATARHWKGINLTIMGRLTEGEAELRAARALDPASLPLQSFLGLNLSWQNRLPEALAEALDLLKRAPEYRNGLHLAFVCGAMIGQARAHQGLLERYFRIIGEDPALAGMIVDALETPSHRPAVIARLEEVSARHQSAGKGAQMGSLFALLQAEKQTLDQIEITADRDSYLPGWPGYDFLRGNPRYEALLAASKRRLEEAQNAPKETPAP